MSDLNRKEKLIIIRQLCENNEITAYEIGEKTKLDVSGVQRILNGETKKPRSIQTLLTIINKDFKNLKYRFVNFP